MQKTRQNSIPTSENFPPKELPEQSSWHGKFATKNRQSAEPNASLTRKDNTMNRNDGICYIGESHGEPQ